MKKEHAIPPGGTVEAAWDILYRRAEGFSRVPNAHYHLACYACLEHACDLSKDPKSLKIQSLEEPDL